MQKTIYIANEGLWESIKKAATENNKSVSAYLVDLHRSQDPSWDIPDGVTAICPECGQNQGHISTCSKFVFQDGESKQEPEPQPDQPEVKKSEEKLKSPPAKKIEPQESSSNQFFKPNPKPEKKGKKGTK